MSVPLDDVVAFLDGKLETHKFDEEASNGLLLRSSETVSRVACAVNTSFHAIARAKFTDADLLVVHHRTWPSIDLELAPQKLDRLKDNGISLYGAHSALDGATGFGNPDLLAAALGVSVHERFLPYHGGLAGIVGRHDRTFAQLVERLRDVLGVPVEAWENAATCKRVAIATRWGADFSRPNPASATEATISPLTPHVNRPSSVAFAARWCDCSASASICSRAIPHSRAMSCAAWNCV